MINNPKIIQEIIAQIKLFTKKDFEKAIKETDKIWNNEEEK